MDHAPDSSGIEQATVTKADDGAEVVLSEPRPSKRQTAPAGKSHGREVEVNRLAVEISRHALELLREQIPVAEVYELLDEAYRIADVPFNAAVAAKWGEENFPDGVPASFVEGCVRLFEEAGGDYEVMARKRLDQLRPGRLNTERVQRLSGDNPERERLLSLAEGMVVPLPEGFEPNGASSLTRPKLRELYLTTHKAVDCKFFEMAVAGVAFVLPMAMAENISGIHFSPAHWAVKQGKACGRPIIDSSDRSATTSVLNGREVAEAAAELWSEIELPTVVDVVKEVLSLKGTAPERPWTDLVVWKLDLKGAFTLMSFRPENSKYFAVELVGGLAMIFLCGLFGWTATPAAFNVISRAILHELRVAMGIRARIYVDDTIAVSWVEKARAEAGDAKAMMEDLCGSGSVADDKYEATRPGHQRVDVLGYCLVLDEQLLTLSRRNFFKTIYAFTTVDVSRPVRVRDLERLASLASRYALICPVLRPFCRPLYASYTGLRRNVSARLSSAAKWSVQMWRAMLCCTMLRERLFARSFQSLEADA